MELAERDHPLTINLNRPAKKNRFNEVMITERADQNLVAMMSDYEGPLKGLKVVDFGHYYAGPMVAMLFADQGADVVRVRKPGMSELSKSQDFLLNRNKSVVTIDLKEESGHQRAMELINAADVVVENFRPGVMESLGLGYEQVKTGNSRLIYLSLPGFASTDTGRRSIRAWEGIMGAASGVFTETSFFRRPLGFCPVYTAVPHCSTYGALHGAVAVMAALIARRTSGTGTVIEVPLVDAGISAYAMMVPFPLFGDSQAGPPNTLRNLAATALDTKSTAAAKLDAAARHNMGMFSPFGGFFTCADGRQIFVWVSGYPILTERYLVALGIFQQVLSEGFVNQGPWKPGLINNISSPEELSHESTQRLFGLVNAAFSKETAAEWESRFAGARVPCAIVRNRDEFLSLQEMLGSGVLSKMVEGAESLVVPGRLADVMQPAAGCIQAAIPRNDQVRSESSLATLRHEVTAPKAGGRKPDRRAMRKGDLLRGLKVLDVSDVLAGPMAAQVLAQLGAEVTKVDTPHFKMMPGILKGYVELGQGKRSIIIDLKTLPGRDVFRRLASSSDVVLHNFLDDVASRLGLDHESLSQISPRVVTAQLSAYGGAERGWWEERLGYDPIAQCASGLMVEYGSLEHPHPHGMSLAADTMGGVCLAFSALLGVYQREEEGYAPETRTSLIRAVSYYQLPNMISGEADAGSSMSLHAAGQFAVGRERSDRMYQCKDGWIYLRDRSKRSLSAAVVGNPETDEASVEARLLERGVREWLPVLTECGIDCHPVLSLAEICGRRRSVSNLESDEVATGALEVLRREDHPCGTPISFMAPDHVRVGEEKTFIVLGAAPSLGAHSRSILEELGFNEGEAARLLKLGAVHEFLPALGAPGIYFFESQHADWGGAPKAEGAAA